MGLSLQGREPGKKPPAPPLLRDNPPPHTHTHEPAIHAIQRITGRAVCNGPFACVGALGRGLQCPCGRRGAGRQMRGGGRLRRLTGYMICIATDVRLLWPVIRGSPFVPNPVVVCPASARLHCDGSGHATGQPVSRVMRLLPLWLLAQMVFGSAYTRTRGGDRGVRPEVNTRDTYITQFFFALCASHSRGCNTSNGFVVLSCD